MARNCWAGPTASWPPPAWRRRAEERRLRHAACLLADIGWRTHPDYRGEQSLNIIANTAFFATDHPGRAFLRSPSISAMWD